MTSDQRIEELEKRVEVLEGLLLKKIGVGEREQELMRVAEEMRRDPTAWSKRMKGARQ
jgi:hypothetical protein